MYGGKSYTSYIKRVLSCDFQILSENGNIDGGGRILKENCYFSLPASPPTLLMLESPNLYAWYPYAYRWWQRIWNFSTSSSFEIIQILVILPKNAISLGIYHEISSNFLSIWGDVIYIIYQTSFIMWLSDHHRKWKYRWRGRILKENCLLLQFTSIFSCTFNARITKLICMIPLCTQMVATYLKFFYVFQFWNNSDSIFLWFYTKIQILCFKESKV